MPADDGAFVSLAELLLGAKTIRDIDLQTPRDVVPETLDAGIPVAAVCEHSDDALRDVRLFRASLADAFDRAIATLVRECAYAVLGRELLLAPSDVAAIAQRLLAEHPAAQPLHVRASLADAEALATHAATLPPIVADATLAPGDVVIAFASGDIDARLGVRVAALLGARA